MNRESSYSNIVIMDIKHYNSVLICRKGVKRIRANLPGVGAGLALRDKGSWQIDSRKTWLVSTRQMDIFSFTIIHLNCITPYFKQTIIFIITSLFMGLNRFVRRLRQIFIVFFLVKSQKKLL